MLLLSLVSLTIKAGVLVLPSVCLLLGSIGGFILGATLTMLGYRSVLGDPMPLGSEVRFVSSEASQAGFLFSVALVLRFAFVLPGIFLTRAFAATGLVVGLPTAALGRICWARLLFGASASVAEGPTSGQALRRSIELPSRRGFRVIGPVGMCVRLISRGFPRWVFSPGRSGAATWLPGYAVLAEA